MSTRAFSLNCHRVKNALAGSPMTHQMLALVLGISPREFLVMEAKDEFPWEHFAAVVQKFPELEINVAAFPELTHSEGHLHQPPRAEEPQAIYSTNDLIEVEARVTRCRSGQALVVLPARPFNGLEIRPNALERLGENLIAVARLARQHRGSIDAKVVLQ
jgi:hypothetical protein